ncbi:MAG: cysteine desulfurase family protein [Patescibacteria group bacterium]|nr:cysteine desulfurase family protein [Patescibacteria group bacterium]
MRSAYLDYAASSPVDPRVREAVLFVMDSLGNPSSVHAQGRAMREAVDTARESVANLLAVEPRRVFFTSGATEANNLALIGYFKRLRETVSAEKPLKLLVSVIEHSSIREVTKRLQADLGVTVEKIPVDADGVVRTDRLREMLSDDVAMVCVMWANNIIGSLQPMEESATIIREEREKRGVNGLSLVLMSDAVQALRTEQVRPSDTGVDLLSLSGHKMYGPKGVGALYVREGVELAPLLMGGGQEAGLRGGTENVPGIVALGRAADILRKEREKDRAHVGKLHARLVAGLRESDGVTVFGDSARSVPGIIYFMSSEETGDVLTLKLDSAGIAVSSGSACDSGTSKTSFVLQEIYSGPAAKQGGVRVSFGRFSTDEDIRCLIEALIAIHGAGGGMRDAGGTR